MFKKEIKKIFPGLVATRNRVYNYFAHYRFKNKQPEEVFEMIYKENHWNDQESKSGTGSSKNNTEEIVKIISDFISTHKIKSMLDIPCGDFNWMKEIDMQGINYIGADIVNDLIIKNNEKYRASTINFKKLDILNSQLPKVDLILCRDCLVHFSYKHIHQAIQSIKNSGSTYLMVSTFPSHSNHDIITGDWRPINLENIPFKFPSPIYMFNESCKEDERYLDKSLGIWKISDL